MDRQQRARGRRASTGVVIAAAVCVAMLSAGCEQRSSPPPPKAATNPPSPAPGAAAIDLPKVDQRLCTAVVLLIDTSGSMSQSVPDRGGAQQPKHLIARRALDRIVDYTNTWRQSHADRVLQLGIYHFSSAVHEVLPMGVFDGAAAKSAVARIPGPGGGTAIGNALEAGFKALYASGCVRKYVVCITDGENTSGPPPDRIARQLFAQTGGEVEIHFVAFDTSAARFAFLKNANGSVVEAADGEQLQAQLSAIYEKRILAEAAAEQP
jgi:uncharacterized protein YegL